MIELPFPCLDIIGFSAGATRILRPDDNTLQHYSWSTSGPVKCTFFCLHLCRIWLVHHMRRLRFFALLPEPAATRKNDGIKPTKTPPRKITQPFFNIDSDFSSCPVSPCGEDRTLVSPAVFSKAMLVAGCLPAAGAVCFLIFAVSSLFGGTMVNPGTGIEQPSHPSLSGPCYRGRWQ